MKRLIVMLLLLACVLESRSQSHQWAKSYYTTSTVATAFSIATDSLNNTYAVGHFSDSLIFDSLKFSVQKSSSIDGYITKFNASGKVIWCKTLYVNDYTFLLREVQIISNKKVVVYGYFNSHKLKFTSNDSLVNTVGPASINGFIAYYDSSGKFINVVRTYTGNAYGYQYPNTYSSNFYNGEFIVDKRGYTYLKFYKHKNTGYINYAKGNIFLSDTIQKNILVKYSPKLDSVIWYKEFCHFLK